MHFKHSPQFPSLFVGSSVPKTPISSKISEIFGPVAEIDVKFSSWRVTFGVASVPKTPISESIIRFQTPLVLKSGLHTPTETEAECPPAQKW